ncbi:ubiquinol-cytochrome C reductase [Cercophora scortea]|uniref:Complex III subunit 9 n=1 Tax=Cercophora scortea TaxID=314031 RepID=A0AAE0J3F8_9PEZI|nr:ubiquinol-cytochrome C reductase [Cercophora scortea]
MAATRSIYNALFRRNYTMLGAVFAGAFAFEMFYDSTMNNIWDKINKGVRNPNPTLSPGLTRKLLTGRNSVNGRTSATSTSSRRSKGSNRWRESGPRLCEQEYLLRHLADKEAEQEHGAWRSSNLYILVQEMAGCKVIW